MSSPCRLVRYVVFTASTFQRDFQQTWHSEHPEGGGAACGQVPAGGEQQSGHTGVPRWSQPEGGISLYRQT